VIQFKPEVAEHYVLKSKKGYLYVGSTRKSVEQRFEDNRTKYKSKNSKRIREHFWRFLPEHYRAKNPIDYVATDPDQLVRYEKNLADKLRNRGWRVEGPTREER
jgi:Uri superfamily endonuclease